MSVGSNIRRRRFELKMSQQELAAEMGYKSRSTIAKIESGENDVTQTKLQKFAAVLDTTVEELISGNERINIHSQALPLAKSSSQGKTAALIMAGGKSSRNQQNIPNQFINVKGKPIIMYCMEAYQAHPAIDDIYVVCLKGWENIVKAYAEQFGITKLRGLIPAGISGILSVRNGIWAIKDRYSKDDTVIIQESTRPMVSSEMISKLLQACDDTGSANICQKMNDYLQFTVEEHSASVVKRENTVEVQSPEAFHLGLIIEVFERAMNKKHPLTESCCALLLDHLGYDIHFVEGSVNNVKIIRQEDIAIFSALTP